MNIPIVSVIIPAFNATQTIIDTLESLRSQTFHAWEALVIDNGSTDETYYLASSYVSRQAETRIQIVRLPNNVGASAARNIGISHAQAEYVAFLDADDILYPNSIARRYQVLQEHTDVPLVFSDYDVKNGNSFQNSILKHKAFLRKINDKNLCNSGEDYIIASEELPVFWQMTPFPIWMGTVMVRRRCMPLFRTDVSVADDTEMWWHIVHKHSAGYVDASTACYRRQFSGLTRNTERYYIDTVKIFSEIRSSERGIVRKHIGAKLAESWFELGYYYNNSGQFKKARPCLIESIRLNPLSFRTYKVFALSFVMPLIRSW